MNTGQRWRMFAIFVVFALGVMFFTPNVKEFSWWPTKEKINYGLDIQGGLYLVLGVDTNNVVRESAARLASGLPISAKEEGINLVSSELIKDSPGGLDMRVQFGTPGDEAVMRDWISRIYGGSMTILSSTPTEMVMRYSDTYVSDLKKRTVEQSIETIRNRIDEFGVSEPSIVAQGDERILVQLPGLEDAARAKDLINRTAKLDFRMVSEEMSAGELGTIIAEAEKAGKLSLKDTKYSEYVVKINEAVKGKLPKGTMVLFGKNPNAVNLETGKVPYLLAADVPLNGDDLSDAYVNINPQYNEPYVGLTFNPAGATKFADLTGKNVGKNLAIVLDNVVYSAPNIRQRIAGGSAEITLGGGRRFEELMDEAKTISMALSAGALPATLEQLEERTVGPTLGRDSIDAGKKASLAGAILVILFMLIYYRSAGVVADFALCFNVFLLLSLLTAFNATLTLPGIAGIALTIGMAVDANVIIFERIKEELRSGAGYRTAVEIGFNKAFWAIFDSNTTTAATSLILMNFGTGPIRGFAVTMVIGILTSLFTAVFVTRTIITYLVNRRDWELSI